ncbi:MAG TPA: bacillithiol biosynthesis cysteine-adding enzyme BshC, partial [Candidatus Glassbacteria bacterium]|nr:bacillithiol biosynthesis cysteine-adding enzyme BshC [Candidatus Glassbacteria bacterium]
QFVPFLPAANRLVTDYLAGKEAAADFYGGWIDEPGRIEKIAGRMDHRFDRKRAADILRGQRTFALVEAGEKRLKDFINRRGFIVVTGQQPVLFGGPLYVLYKTASALALANRIENLLGVPVLTVFWNASEDHDFQESSSIRLPDLQNRLVQLTISPGAEANQPLCHLQVGAEAGLLFDRLKEISPDTEFAPGVLSLLAASYTGGVDLGLAFSRLIAGFFSGRGLFVVDACSPELRKYSRELFEAEIFDSAASSQAVASANQRLEELGYPLQVAPQPDDTSLFLITDSGREKLQRTARADVFRLKNSGTEIPAVELRRLLDSYPTSFSPGVQMRPLMEASLFGTLCYVAGPGEISYYAQLGPLYDLRGLEMPLIYPRLGGILVESKIGRVLEKFAIQPAELEAGAERVARGLAGREGLVSGLMAEIGALRDELEKRIVRLGETAEKIDPTLAGPLNATRQAIGSGLDKFSAKLEAAAARRDETLLAQLGKAATHLWPEGKPQERTIAAVYYFLRYGLDLIDFTLDQVRVKIK